MFDIKLFRMDQSSVGEQLQSALEDHGFIPRTKLEKLDLSMVQEIPSYREV